MDRTGITEPRKLKWIGLLLALNLGVFVAGLVLQRWVPAASEPLVYNADKIRLLALPDISVAPQPLSAARPERMPASVPAKEPAEPNSASAQPNLRCLSWPSLDDAALAAIESYLAQAGVGSKAYDIELEKTLGWWVFLPPAKNKAELQATIDEVHRLGVADYAPVRGGSMRNALSLGAFAKLEQAREHAAKLIRKGVREAQYGPRPEAGRAQLMIADAVPPNVLANLNKAWPNGLQPVRCAAP